MRQILSFDICHYSKPSNAVLTPGDKHNGISTTAAVQSSLKTDTAGTTTASYKRLQKTANIHQSLKEKVTGTLL